MNVVHKNTDFFSYAKNALREQKIKLVNASHDRWKIPIKPYKNHVDVVWLKKYIVTICYSDETGLLLS